MVNDLGFTKNAALLQAIVNQATGRNYLAPINREQFVTVGQIALKAGYEQLLNSISSVMAKTIFSIRPYSQKLRTLEVSNQQWGDMTRKLKMMDSPWQENQQYDLPEGTSVDMYTIRKEKVLQMNFYGYQTYSREMMIWYNQLNVAFSSPEEFNRFLGMKMQNTLDQIAQGNEEFSRQAIANLIIGVWSSSIANTHKHDERVVHLVTEYNNYAGTALTPEQILLQANFVSFAQWFYARFAEIIGLLEHRSELFHQNPYEEDWPLNQHTPKDKMIAYIYEPFMTLLDTTVHSEIFHNEYLKFMKYEPISYWQSIANDNTENPNSTIINSQRAFLKGSGTYLNDAGELVKSTLDEHNTKKPIIGVLFDRDAAGMAIFDEHQNRTPWNASGDYAKIFFKYTNRYWNDFTENAVIFLFD